MINLQRLVIVTIMAFILSGCNEKFKSGETVWVSMDDETISLEGYAVGKVIETKDDMIRIQIEEVSRKRNINSELLITPGNSSFISADKVYAFKEGKTGFEERKRALEIVQDGINSKTPINDKDISLVTEVSTKYGSLELRAMIEIYEALKDLYMGLNREQQLDKFPDLLENIKNIMKGYTGLYKEGGYRFVVDSYKSKEGRRVHKRATEMGIPVFFKRPDKLGLGVGDLAEVTAVMLTNKLYKLLIDDFFSGGVSFSEVDTILPIAQEADAAFYRFVTNDGENMPGKQSLKKLLLERDEYFRGLVAAHKAMNFRDQVMGIKYGSKPTNDMELIETKGDKVKIKWYKKSKNQKMSIGNIKFADIYYAYSDGIGFFRAAIQAKGKNVNKFGEKIKSMYGIASDSKIAGFVVNNEWKTDFVNISMTAKHLYGSVGTFVISSKSLEDKYSQLSGAK